MQYDENAEKYGYEGEMTPMKCDELTPLVFSINDLAFIYEHAVQKNFENPHDHAFYKATEVDAAIAELKDVIHELQVDLEGAKATAYAESVDAGMRERRLRRALYKACANWADVVAFEETEGIGHDNSVAERWRKMESKCLAKAKEYK